MNTNSNLAAAMALAFAPSQIQTNMVLRASPPLVVPPMSTNGWSNHSEKRGGKLLAKRRRKNRLAKQSRRKNR